MSNTPFHEAMLALDKDGLGRIPLWAWYTSPFQHLRVVSAEALCHRFGEMHKYQIKAVRLEIYDRMVDRQTRRIVKPR